MAHIGNGIDPTRGIFSVGSEKWPDEQPKPSFVPGDETGWPYFVCRKAEQPGENDYYTAIGIGSLADAKLYRDALAVRDAARKMAAVLRDFDTSASWKRLTLETRRKEALAAAEAAGIKPEE